MRLGSAVLVFLAVCLILSRPGMAETGGAIGVIDVNIIFSQTEAAKSIEKQRQALRQEFLDEIAKHESDLRLLEQDLAAMSSDKDKGGESGRTQFQEDYAKKRKAYEDRLTATRKLAQEKKRQLELLSSKALDALRSQLYVVAQEIANERGYSLVISSRDVIAGQQSLDITDETLKRLNERVKDIPLQDTPAKADSGKEAQ